MPTVSCSFSSEKSYSPSRLMCCQEIAEPWATASRNASASLILGLFELLRQVEIVPADDAVLDEPLAAFRQLLVFLLRLQKLPRISHRDGAREAVCVLYPVQLLFDSPASAAGSSMS